MRSWARFTSLRRRRPDLPTGRRVVTFNIVDRRIDDRSRSTTSEALSLFLRPLAHHYAWFKALPVLLRGWEGVDF
jgi:hypothetical protein